MKGGLLGTLAHRVRHEHRTPELAAMRAVRNLGIAAGFLPADLRTEATAAVLVYRILKAYENVSAQPGAVVAAVDYLNGDTDTPPPPVQAMAVRGTEPVDLVLTERIRDVRELLAELPFEGRERVGRLLADVGRGMALNLDCPLSRTAYGESVLGRVVLYVCSLVAEDACAEVDLSELAGCTGVTVQLANDLRDGDLALYGACDREELTQAVMQRMLAPALCSFALLARLGPCIHNRGARLALAYMTITTTGSLCAAVGATAPYRRPLRLVAALLATVSTAHWTAMLNRVRCSVSGAIQHVLDASPDPPGKASRGAPSGATDLLAVGDPRTVPSSVGPLIVGAAFALTEALPPGPLTGELPESEVHRMMIADHLTFCALERLRPRDADAMSAFAMRLQSIALAPLYIEQAQS